MTKSLFFESALPCLLFDFLAQLLNCSLQIISLFAQRSRQIVVH